MDVDHATSQLKTAGTFPFHWEQKLESSSQSIQVRCERALTTSPKLYVKTLPLLTEWQPSRFLGCRSFSPLKVFATAISFAWNLLPSDILNWGLLSPSETHHTEDADLTSTPYPFPDFFP